jgi:hypothetical protein
MEVCKYSSMHSSATSCKLFVSNWTIYIIISFYFQSVLVHSKNSEKRIQWHGRDRTIRRPMVWWLMKWDTSEIGCVLIQILSSKFGEGTEEEQETNHNCLRRTLHIREESKALPQCTPAQLQQIRFVVSNCYRKWDMRKWVIVNNYNNNNSWP